MNNKSKYLIRIGIILITVALLTAAAVYSKREEKSINSLDGSNNILTESAISSGKENTNTELLNYKISDNAELEQKGIEVTIPEEMAIYVGNTEKITLKASVKPAKMVSYRSLDEDIAKVVGGVVIAEKVGSTSVVTTALIKDKYYEFTTKVTVKPGKVKMTADKETIAVGETTRITTKVSLGVINSMSYLSSNTDVAVVKKNGIYGMVEGLSEGTATITVKVNVGGKTTKSKMDITVVKAKKNDLPVSNPVNAKDFTVDDDWQGSRVFFGKYEQDNKLENGSEPILWRVLQVKEDTLLLLSEYGLVCKCYNDTFDEVTWETSTIRAWLNGEFLDTAFTNKERDAINDTLVVNDDNEKYHTDGGKDTVDKVYLLSYDEAMNNAYGFQSGKSNKSKTRQMKITPAALVEGYVNKDNGNTCWWLRSPGITNQYAAYVFTTGSITDSYFVGRRFDGIRPVIQVKLSSIIFGDKISDGNGNSYIQLIAK